MKRDKRSRASSYLQWAKNLVLLILLAYGLWPMTSAESSTVSVCNMPSSSSVQIRIYNITTTTETVAWTATGVTERAVGLSKSCYYYSATITAGHEYQIDWRDASSPTKVASEGISGYQTLVTVGTNNDKTGYTASTVSDKTGYSLSQTFPTNFSSFAITEAGAVTAGTVSDKTGYTASTVSDKTGYTATCSTVSDKTGYTCSTVSDKTGYTATCSTVSDKTGYTLSQTFPSNFSSLSIDVSGKVHTNTADVCTTVTNPVRTHGGQ